MEGWQIALAVVMGIGTAVILLGAFVDRARNRRAEEALYEPPDRDIPGLSDPEAPHYLSAVDAARTRQPAPAGSETLRQRVQTRCAEEPGWEAVLVSETFVTDPQAGLAIATEPIILVGTDPITAIRELLPAMQLAQQLRRTLVILAPDFAEEVRRTLEVNQLQGTLRLVVVQGSAEVAAQVATECSATALDRTDLQSGHCPPQALGTVPTWVSSSTRSWLLEALVSPEG